MDDKKFYGLITFIFGIIGVICSVIMITILIIGIMNTKSFGNLLYIYCSCIIILCFICNRHLYKKSEKSRLSTFGSLFGILSIVPIVLFLITFFIVLFLGAYLINYTPHIF